MQKSKKSEPNILREVAIFVGIIALGIIFGLSLVLVFQEQIVNFFTAG